MLCFILDRPHRGRYFHDCNTPRDIRFAVLFYRFSAADALPARSPTQLQTAEKSSQKSGPDSLNDVSQKL